MVEVTSFTLMALFIARLGAVALASHQIVASLAALLYMVPLALGIASSARTGYWLGAGQAHKARRAAALGIGLAMAAALLGAAILFTGREALAQAFSKDPGVVQAAQTWLAWVALYHLADAVQAVCAYLLRCYRITLMPLLIYTALLWGVGLYGGYVLAYQGLDWAGWPMRASVDTFWMTSTAALALVSLLFTAMVWRASRLTSPQPRMH
jgi:MATE family multidrug resistance protein